MSAKPSSFPSFFPWNYPELHKSVYGPSLIFPSFLHLNVLIRETNCRFQIDQDSCSEVNAADF